MCAPTNYRFEQEPPHAPGMPRMNRTVLQAARCSIGLRRIRGSGGHCRSRMPSDPAKLTGFPNPCYWIGPRGRTKDRASASEAVSQPEKHLTFRLARLASPTGHCPHHRSAKIAEWSRAQQRGWSSDVAADSRKARSHRARTTTGPVESEPPLKAGYEPATIALEAV